MTDILSALIAGLPFIGAPIGQTVIETSKAAQALVTGIQQAPGLAKSFWPTSGTAEVMQNASHSSAITNSLYSPN